MFMCLEAIDELAHVVSLTLNSAQYRAVANWAIGAEEDEVVGEVGSSEAEV